MITKISRRRCKQVSPSWNQCECSVGQESLVKRLRVHRKALFAQQLESVNELADRYDHKINETDALAQRFEEM